MQSVLLLVHRIPYPPNKGDKIRSYHLLRYLSSRYRVFVGAFVDDPFDLQYDGEVKALCEQAMLLPMNPTRRKIASLQGLATGEALSLPYYRDSRMQSWVDATLAREPIESVVVFSSTMAQFVDGPRYAHLNRIADFVDVDSDKWAQYAARASGVRRWVYRREAAALQVYERHVAQSFNAVMITMGQFNILAMCLFDDLETLVTVASDQILALPGVHHVETSIAVRTMKYDTRLAKITPSDAGD